MEIIKCKNCYGKGFEENKGYKIICSVCNGHKYELKKVHINTFIKNETQGGN